MRMDYLVKRNIRVLELAPYTEDLVKYSPFTNRTQGARFYCCTCDQVDQAFVINNMCSCVCVCVFIKLHITVQSGPVILVILCHSR